MIGKVEPENTTLVCEKCGVRGPLGGDTANLFHVDGCEVAGGTDPHLSEPGEPWPAVENYPIGYPGCHPADPVACPECMDGVAHVGIFGDRKRDPNRVLFLEVRALVPGACFLIHRGREPRYALEVLEQVRRLIACANHDGYRISPAEALDRAGARRRWSLWRGLFAWFRGERS